MATDDSGELLRAGIEAVRAGQRQKARALLVQVLKADPRSELAWMWMVSAVDTDKERHFCLAKILEINPGNARARQMLQRIEQSGAAREGALPPAPRQPVYKASQPLPEPGEPPATASAPTDAVEQPAPPRADASVPEPARAERAPSAAGWRDWPEPDFEDNARPAAETAIGALRAEALEEQRDRRGRSRRLRRWLLFLLCLAMIVLAAVVISSRLDSALPGVAETPSATLEASPTSPATPTRRPTATATVTAPTPTQETTPPTEETTGAAGPAREGDLYQIVV